HDVKKPEAVEGRSVLLMTVGQVAYCFDIINRGRDDAFPIVPFGIVDQRPSMHGSFCSKALKALTTRLHIAFGGKTLRAVPASTPPLGAVFEPDIEHVAATGDAQSDGIWRAPFIEAIRIKKSDEGVELRARTSERARSSQKVVKILC